jgi:hypothetical protein
MKVTSELDRIVLQAVSEDCESFDTVVSKLSRLGSFISGTCDIDKVERSLLSSVANRLVEAYVIHADPPYATAVNADTDSVRRYWYCLTEAGRQHLRGIL